MSKHRLSPLVVGTTVLAALSMAACSRPRPGATVGCFQMGEQISSKLDLSLAVTLNRSPQPQQMHLTGAWTATPVDSHDGVVEVAYQIENPHVTLQGHQQTPAPDLLQAESEFASGLGRRFYVRHRPEGAALAISFDRGYDVSLANVLRTIVGMSQMVQSATDSPAWTVLEQDGNGQVLASYVRGEGGRISKRKLRYLVDTVATNDAHRQIGSVAVPEIREAGCNLTRDPRGRVREVKAKERISLALTAAHLAVETEAELSLSESESRVVSAMMGDYERRKADLLTQPVPGTAADPASQHALEDRRVLGKATFDQVWGELLALRDPQESADNSDTVRKLVAIFRLQETALAETLRRLPTIPELHAKIVVDALSLAGTNATQDALASVAGDEHLATMPRLYAIRYLSHQDHPTSAALSALAGLLDDTDADRRQMARLAFGTIISKLTNEQKPQAERLIGALVERLARATDDTERGDLYLALGNTASPLAFASLEQASQRGTPLLRGTALQAIGRIADPRVAPLLEQTLRAEEEPIRMAALNGIGRRELGPLLPALVKSAQDDESPYVRSAAVELLGTALDSTPQLRPVLAERARKDRDTRVRAAATRLLAPTASRDL